MDDVEPLDEVELRQGITNMAEILRHYHQELLRQGFSKREAMALLLAYQRNLMGANHE